MRSAHRRGPLATDPTVQSVRGIGWKDGDPDHAAGSPSFSVLWCIKGVLRELGRARTHCSVALESDVGVVPTPACRCSEPSPEASPEPRPEHERPSISGPLYRLCRILFGRGEIHCRGAWCWAQVRGAVAGEVRPFALV